jgi:hypothetical protein
LRFRVASDFDGGEGFWTLHAVSVAAAASTVRSGQDPQDLRRFTVRPEPSVPAPVTMTVYEGRPALSPAHRLARIVWNAGDPIWEVRLEGPAPQTRIDLVWRDADGRWNSREDVLEVPGPNLGAAFRLDAVPNPVRRGSVQTWLLTLDNEGVPGPHRLILLNSAGRRVQAREIAVAVPGTREVAWPLVDASGRVVAAGVYFLQAQGPTGHIESKKLIVLP